MTPLDLMLEGFGAVLAASSLALLVLGLATGLSARAAAIPALVSFGLGTTTLTWLRFTGRGAEYPDQLVAAVLVLAVFVIMSPVIDRPDFAAVPGGLLAGGAAAVLWNPQTELNALTTDLAGRGTVGGIAWTGLFFFALLSPLWLAALLHHLTPDWLLDRLEPPWSVLGATVIVLASLAAALGLFPEIVERIADRSEPAASQTSPASPSQDELSPETPQPDEESSETRQPNPSNE